LNAFLGELRTTAAKIMSDRTHSGGRFTFLYTVNLVEVSLSMRRVTSLLSTRARCAVPSVAPAAKAGGRSAFEALPALRSGPTYRSSSNATAPEQVYNNRKWLYAGFAALAFGAGALLAQARRFAQSRHIFRW